jgi:hypothetical protein
MEIKLSVKNIFSIAHIAVLIMIIISLFWLTNFLYNDVYKTTISESADFQNRINVNLQNLNITKFEEVINEIENKKKGNNLEVNNFFH